MERLTERVKGESFPVRGITYIEIVEQLAKYEDREEGKDINVPTKRQTYVHCKNCRYVVESDSTNKLFCSYHEDGERNPNDYCTDWVGK